MKTYPFFGQISTEQAFTAKVRIVEDSRSYQRSEGALRNQMEDCLAHRGQIELTEGSQRSTAAHRVQMKDKGHPDRSEGPHKYPREI